MPAARPVAEWAYTLVRHERHTHLAYHLKLPKRRRPAEREINIEREVSYLRIRRPMPGVEFKPDDKADHDSRSVRENARPRQLFALAAAPPFAS